ncbi:acetylornithine aminotransferase [Lambiella insularis]|nr:acetylornithine aminotransferase [Lambiella insularis]
MPFRPVPYCLSIVGKSAARQLVEPWTLKRNASAMAVPTSSTPESIGHDISNEASLPTPDPASDSSTAAMVNRYSPYMVATYVRPPPMMVKGEGCYIWDMENRRYLDFTAGIAVNALGHCDAEMSKLISQQARTLVHASNLYHNPWTGELSKLLVTKTRESGAMHAASKVFVCNSGSEANEAAIKFARKVGKVRDPSGGKYGLVSFQNSFHGRTLGSLSATPNPKYQKPFTPMLPGFKYGTYNDEEGVKDLITDQTCGVIVEPIQGEGGVIVANTSFLQALRDRCDEVGAILIYDEIQCGLSRTGTFWAHGSLPASAHPDILTTAKALGNGFPIGATMVTEEVSQCIVTGDHGTTFGGNPLACRLAHYIVSRLSETELQKEVLKKEKLFRDGFARLQAVYPDVITEVRGRGLMLGVQLTQDPAPIITAARERGLLIITGGTNTLRFVPPLVVSRQQIEDGLRVLGEAMKAVLVRPEAVEGPGRPIVPASNLQLVCVNKSPTVNCFTFQHVIIKGYSVLYRPVSQAPDVFNVGDRYTFDSTSHLQSVAQKTQQVGLSHRCNRSSSLVTGISMAGKKKEHKPSKSTKDLIQTRSTRRNPRSWLGPNQQRSTNKTDSQTTSVPARKNPNASKSTKDQIRSQATYSKSYSNLGTRQLQPSNNRGNLRYRASLQNRTKNKTNSQTTSILSAGIPSVANRNHKKLLNCWTTVQMPGNQATSNNTSLPILETNRPADTSIISERYATSSTAAEKYDLTHNDQSQGNAKDTPSSYITFTELMNSRGKPKQLCQSKIQPVNGDQPSASLLVGADPPAVKVINKADGSLLQPSADLLDFLELRRGFNTWLQIAQLRNRSRHPCLKQYVASVLEEFEIGYRSLEDTLAKKLFPLSGVRYEKVSSELAAALFPVSGDQTREKEQSPSR